MKGKCVDVEIDIRIQGDPPVILRHKDGMVHILALLQEHSRSQEQIITAC